MDKPRRTDDEVKYYQNIEQPQKFNKSFTSTINDRDEMQFTKNYISTVYNKQQDKLKRVTHGNDDDLIKSAYMEYNKEHKMDVIKDYFIP